MSAGKLGDAPRYNLIGDIEDADFKTAANGSPCLFFKLRRGPRKSDFVRCAVFDDLALAMSALEAGAKVKLLGIWQQHRIGYRRNMPVKAQRFRGFWYESMSSGRVSA